MSFEIVRRRVESHFPKTIQEEENAIKEVYQEIALSALARSGFFKHAAFQGGTCLRIVYQLNRFSEDLDFCLLGPNQTFSWAPFLGSVKDEFTSFGIELDVSLPKKEDNAVRHAVLKDNSFVRVFNLSYSRNKSHKQNICIKFEVDTNRSIIYGQLFHSLLLASATHS